MPRLQIEPQQDWTFRALAIRSLRLQQRRHLLRMHRIHTCIGVGRHEQYGRILNSGLHAVIWRIRVKPPELLRIFCRSIFRNPQFRDLEILVPQHVKQRNLADHSAKQIWTLRKSGAYQQAAVAATLNRQPLRIRVFFRDQILGSGDEVIKDILLDRKSVV